MLFNPSSMDRLSHVLSGCWQAGAFFVLSVSAWYLIKRRHVDLSGKAIKIALILAVTASLLQLITGHQSAVGVSENQPAKLAAFEGHYEASAPAPLYLFGWVNEEKQEVRFGIAVPKLLSFLVYGDFNRPITGLNAFAPEDRPPVNLVFQGYHLMVAIGFGLIAISLLGLFLWWRGTLTKTRWYLYILVFSVLLPQLANQLGWISAEVGRQPWIVYNLLRTSDGLSKAVSAGQVWFSLIFFVFIYGLLFVLFIYLLNEKIKHGPEAVEDTSSVYAKQQSVLNRGE
jgi:cytochrome d ubiquinol oxidase subunit I